MTLNNEKNKFLKKLSPFYRHEEYNEQEYSGLSPQYTSAYDTLDDPIFGPAFGETGLFFPDRFIKEIKHNFYLLDRNIEGKIPVVFVHGAGGTPADWKYFIKNINHDKFSPIVFYYPTSIRLGSSADLLCKGLKEIHKYHGPVILVAHSMGGLVSRGAIRLLFLENLKDYISLYVSLSTPYGGHTEVQRGVERLPDSAIVPSWKDLASDSEFIKTLYDPSILPEIDFRLFFGYKDPKKFRIGANSDGIISIKSQLDFRAQKESFRQYGFDDDHETILKDPEVVSMLNIIFEKELSKLK